VRPGDLLVVPADAGGCDTFGWNPESTALVEDLAEPAHRAQRGQWALRLPATRGSRLADAFSEGADDPTLLRQQLVTIGALPFDAPARLQVHWYRPGDPSAGAILMERTHGRAAATTEDDRGSFDAEPVTLEAHLRDVRGWTERFAERLPLTTNERHSLTLAAMWHDVGKADLRFQAMLRGETRMSRFDDRPAIAKGAVPWGPGARERAGLPSGWRHEVMSAIAASQALDHVPDDVRDLALWLVATHHGRGRPFFEAVPDTTGGMAPIRVDGHPLPTAAASDPDVLITDHVDRFERLVSRHGAHRLAWLEAILRLADHRASAVGGPEVS
jgi:CRISPR-associated endonuclease/helicase Cas3